MPFLASADLQRRVHAQAFRPVQAGKTLPSSIRLSARGYANGAAPPPSSGQTTSGGGGGNGGTLVILAALAAIAAGGYWFLKPVRDVAAKANTGLEAVKQNGVSRRAGAVMQTAYTV